MLAGIAAGEPPRGRAPAGSTSHSAVRYRVPSASGVATPVTSRVPSGDRASPAQRGRATKAARSWKGVGVRRTRAHPSRRATRAVGGFPTSGTDEETGFLVAAHLPVVLCSRTGRLPPPRPVADRRPARLRSVGGDRRRCSPAGIRLPVSGRAIDVPPVQCLDQLGHRLGALRVGPADDDARDEHGQSSNDPDDDSGHHVSRQAVAMAFRNGAIVATSWAMTIGAGLTPSRRGSSAITAKYGAIRVGQAVRRPPGHHPRR